MYKVSISHMPRPNGYTLKKGRLDQTPAPDWTDHLYEN